MITLILTDVIYHLVRLFSYCSWVRSISQVSPGQQRGGRQHELPKSLGTGTSLRRPHLHEAILEVSAEKRKHQSSGSVGRSVGEGKSAFKGTSCVIYIYIQYLNEKRRSMYAN